MLLKAPSHNIRILRHVIETAIQNQRLYRASYSVKGERAESKLTDIGNNQMDEVILGVLVEIRREGLGEFAEYLRMFV